MAEIKAVVFDMDGVLLDSETICDRVWKITSKEYNIDSSYIVTACRGTNRADSVAIIKNHFGSNFPADDFMNRSSELFYEVEKSEGIPLMPFVKDTLEYLKKKYRLCVASSTRKVHVMRQLKNAGILPYFETITTGDMVKHSKPDPEIYLMACESLGLKPENCVAVEDSPNGIKSAYAAGLRPVMVPDKIQPDDELKKILFKLCTSLADIKLFL